MPNTWKKSFFIYFFYFIKIYLKNSATKEYQVPYESEVECKNIIIVYDSNTSNLHEKGAAIKCARLLFESGSKDSVKILKGGYETFSGLYPFLRTQQIIYMPRVI